MVTLKQNSILWVQYVRRNNLVLSGIAENILDNQFEITVALILSDIELNIQSERMKTCYRFGKTDRKT